MAVQLNLRSSSAAILLATVGISISTLLFGANSTPYLVSAFGAGALSLTYVSRNRTRASIAALLIFALTIFTATGAIGRTYEDTDLAWTDEFAKVTALSIVILLALVAGSQAEKQFRSLMTAVALFHLCILSYGLVSGGALETDVGLQRFSTDTIGTSAWSEIALGTIMAAVLGRNSKVTFAALTLGAFIFLMTQLRTAGLSAFALVLMLVAHRFYIARATGFRFLVVCVSALSLFALFATFGDIIGSTFRSALLLDDPHRGLESGFSGRFDNVAVGIEIFLSNFFFGAGFSDPLANKTHNGYIMTLAQMGVILGGFLISVFLLAVYRSAKSGNAALLAVCVALAVFYMGQPRNLSFQLCPLVGIFACSRALSWQRLHASARVRGARGYVISN